MTSLIESDGNLVSSFAPHICKIKMLEGQIELQVVWCDSLTDLYIYYADHRIKVADVLQPIITF